MYAWCHWYLCIKAPELDRYPGIYCNQIAEVLIICSRVESVGIMIFGSATELGYTQAVCLNRMDTVVILFGCLERGELVHQKVWSK